MRATIPLLCLLALPIAAQDAVWRLPARGAAEYRRTHKETSGVADSAGAAAKLAVKAAPPAGIFAHLAPAPWLCQGELTLDQRAIGDEPRELRDLLRAVACDLRLDGITRLRYRRLVPFGDLVLTGRVAAASPDGSQTFELLVSTDDPEHRPGESKADLQLHVRPLCKWSASGSLRMTRVFDATAGVLRSFTGELTLVFEEKRGVFRKLVARDQWDLVAVHDNQDAAFRAAVAAAIRSGAQWVQNEFKTLSPRYLVDQRDGARSYGSGRLALGLLTMLHAEVPKDDPVVVGCLAELRRRVLIDSYSLGVALMALAQLYAPAGEADLVRSGVLLAPRPRLLSDEDKQLAEEWLAKLRENIDTREDQGYRLRFNYIAGRRFDNSVTQYALLGLHAAELCGLDVPASAWRAAANHLLGVQADANGRTLALELTTHRELATGTRQATAKLTRASSVPVPTRGYAYQGPEKPPYGSMTAAGITGLVIARAGLLRDALDKADVLPAIDVAIRCGFAWLSAEFHVRSNPGFIGRADDHWYYWLYGLERVCELSAVALLQGRDWYYEGALQVLAQQQENGSFRPERAQGQVLDATCFAVLFLKKATLPVITGG